ncbi:MAG: hypothetical protein PVH00_07920 [Gemmatimonadota bacterium]
MCGIDEIDETETGEPCIAMAYCAGETLKNRLGRGPLSSSDAVDGGPEGRQGPLSESGEELETGERPS